MKNELALIFSSLNHISFVPHGECWLWDWRMVTLHLISNGLIGVAYYSISSILFYILLKTRENPYIRSRALTLYILFIFLCGTTHFSDIVTIYYPIYWLDGLLKLITGIISILAMLETFRVASDTIKDINKYYSLLKPRIEAALNKRLSTSSDANIIIPSSRYGGN